MLRSQPSGLYTLSFTELWERFGFYLVQVLIVLFLTKELGFADGKADLITGAFGGLLYITPVIGGWLADRYIGFRRAVIIGAVILFLGYALLMSHSETMFYWGLAVLVIGNGFLKPCISSILGDLYTDDEAKREGGFTIFYAFINIGAIIPPLITGTIVDHWGWHYGFGLAALGMILALIIFTTTNSVIWRVGNIPENSPLKSTAQKRIRFKIIFWSGTAIATGLAYWGVNQAGTTNWVIVAAAVIFVVYVLSCIRKEHHTDRRRLIGAILLMVLAVGFWSLYNETFTSEMLFAERNLDLHLFGFPITPEFTQFYNSFVIIICGPLFNLLWQRLDRYHLNPSIPLKFAYGILLMCLAFALLAWGTNGNFGIDGKISGWWLVWSYVVQTFGELCLSPIGLAMITVLAPKNLVGLMMGMWFFVIATSYAISGVIAQQAAIPHGSSALMSLSIFHNAFTTWTWASAILVAVSFIIYPFVNRLIELD
jgi:POT family proton-dependent oligopeptide transporter